MLRFIKYNNALPIAISFLLLSFSGVLAASPEVQDAMYSETDRVVSVDNTYIANKDLASYTPRVQITGVTEDDSHYFVHYHFMTIGVVNAIWQDTGKDEVMKVDKRDIVGKDLGLYVTEQLRQTIDRELSILREVQEIERQNVTAKVVATEYSGLIGKFLDDKTEELPGYIPVVEEQSPAGEKWVDPNITAGGSSGTVPGSTTSGDSIPPTLQILGNNPARILKGSTYADLGVVVTDNVNFNLGYKTYVNGTPATEVQVLTTTPGTWIVKYEATDGAGNMAWIERVVEVYDPYAPSPQTATTSDSSKEIASSTP